jgi:ribonuclease BN (tRNA processing enzyme)
MWLTVLGSAASYPGPGQACAGYLVEQDGTHVLFDCGHGVLSNLGEVIDPLSLDALLISHGHPDHFADIYALQSLLRYAPEGPADPLALYLPPGLFERMTCLLSERGAGELAAAFVLHELADGEQIDLGSFTVTPRSVEHTAGSFAFVITDGAATLCYSADTSPGEPILEVARGCDLLLADATLPEQFAGAAPHMTAREAGALARDADVGALVLTHIWATNDRREMLAEAAEVFDGPVAVANEYDTYEVIATSRLRKGPTHDASRWTRT